MKISHWISAFRLRTLFLSLSCIWAGWIALDTPRNLHSPIAIFTMLTALFLQILSNLANDYGDSIHGADHDGRKGPSRMVQAGLISDTEMKRGLILFAVLSFLSGCLLLYYSVPVIGFWAAGILFGIGLLCIAAAIAYTNGKRPYGYAGLGDISVFIFFGLVSVLGSHYLQSGKLNANAWALATAYGALSVGVLNLNNMRDIESDRHAGKKSIPVRIGLALAKKYHTALLLIAFLSLGYYCYASHIPPLNVFPLNIILLVNIGLALKANTPQAFDPLLKWLSLSTFIITLLLQLNP